MALLSLAEEHLELILGWRNSPHVREKMYTSHIISWEEHCAWFEKIKSSNTSKWFLYCEKNGRPAGVVGFTDINDRSHGAFWGFYTAEGSPSGTGSRMGYEALEYAFQDCRLHKLNGEALASNVKSIDLHENLGFTKEGIFRDHYFDGQNYVNVIRMGILVNEWIIKKQDILNRLAKFTQTINC